MVFRLRDRLAHYWQAEVKYASSGFYAATHCLQLRSNRTRGVGVSPLYPEMLEEIQSAVIFPQVLAIHQDLIKLMPFSIPEAEQTYFFSEHSFFGY